MSILRLECTHEAIREPDGDPRGDGNGDGDGRPWKGDKVAGLKGRDKLPGASLQARASGTDPRRSLEKNGALVKVMFHGLYYGVLSDLSSPTDKVHIL